MHTCTRACAHMHAHAHAHTRMQTGAASCFVPGAHELQIPCKVSSPSLAHLRAGAQRDCRQAASLGVFRLGRWIHLTRKKEEAARSS